MQYILSLASQTNNVPLPPVPEVFGVRLPSASECLTAVDFDLVPNQPPPGVKLYDEEVEEVEESEEEDEEDMEPAAIPSSSAETVPSQPTQEQRPPPAPMGAIQTASDVDMITSGGGLQEEEGSEVEEDGLFAGGDEEEESGNEQMDVAVPAPDAAVNGIKRKLDEDYD